MVCFSGLPYTAIELLIGHRRCIPRGLSGRERRKACYLPARRQGDGLKSFCDWEKTEDSSVINYLAAIIKHE